MFKTQKQWFYLLASLALYTVYFSWQTSLAIVGTLLFHENCHIWVGKKYGLTSEGITLIPLVGMIANMSGELKTRWQSVWVSMAGPVGGGLFGLLVAILFFITKVHWLSSLAILMVMINLGNLVPASIVDGGKIFDAVAFSINETVAVWYKIISTLLLTVVLLKFAPLLAMFIGIIGGMDAYKHYMMWKARKDFNYGGLSHQDIFPPKPLTLKEGIIVMSAWAFTTAGFAYLLVILITANKG